MGYYNITSHQRYYPKARQEKSVKNNNPQNINFSTVNIDLSQNQHFLHPVSCLIFLACWS